MHLRIVLQKVVITTGLVQTVMCADQSYYGASLNGTTRESPDGERGEQGRGWIDGWMDEGTCSRRCRCFWTVELISI